MSSASTKTKSQCEQKQRETGPLWKRCFSKLGPGLITGASDDDPSGIGTYSQCGAQFGFSFLWASLFSLPLMITVQYLCAKVALVTGRGLAGVLRKHYPRPIVFASVILLLVANTINAGADLGAIAAGLKLLWPACDPKIAVPIIGAGILLMQMLAGYKLIAHTFKWLTLALFAYIATVFFVHLDPKQVAVNTLVPHMALNKDSLTMLVAILGTTISPYLFFWQASQEVEEAECEGSKEIHKQGASKPVLNDAFYDVSAGMVASNAVMFFIILTTAATLHAHGIKQINTAAEAASALKPLAGSFAETLFAVGLIGTGLLAVPILIGSSVFGLTESLGMKFKLSQKPGEAKFAYSVMSACMLLGVLLNYSGISPMVALYWTAVINGLLAPPLLVLIMFISNNRTIMGDNINSHAANVLGWACTVIMAGAAVAFFVAK